MRRLIKPLRAHAALGRVLMFAGGALATVLYALLSILATSAVMRGITPAIATLLKQCLWTLVGVLSGLEVLVMGYLYQQMLSHYRTEFQLYRTLGMPLWYLALRLIGENGLWAILTSGIGVAAGFIGSKFFAMWLFRMMSLPLNTGLLWSARAASQLLIGYTIGYSLLAVTGWLRFCRPLGSQDRHKPTSHRHLNDRWQWLIALLAPLGLLASDYGLAHWSTTPPTISAWLSLTMIGIFAVCAFTLPAGLALIARTPGIRQHATRLLSVATCRQLLQRYWLTIGLTTGLLTGGIALLLSGLMQYQALHTAKTPLLFLANLATVDGVSVDAAAGITLFTTTMLSFAMLVAAAIILGLVQRLNAWVQNDATTLYQLGMPRAALVRIKQRQAGLVAGLPLLLGVLKTVVILAGRMTLLQHEHNNSWFMLVSVLLYLAVVQIVSRSSAND